MLRFITLNYKKKAVDFLSCLQELKENLHSFNRKRHLEWCLKGFYLDFHSFSPIESSQQAHTCSKLTRKRIDQSNEWSKVNKKTRQDTQRRGHRSDSFMVKSDQIQYIDIVFLLSTLKSRYIRHILFHASSYN